MHFQVSSHCDSVIRHILDKENPHKIKSTPKCAIQTYLKLLYRSLSCCIVTGTIHIQLSHLTNSW